MKYQVKIQGRLFEVKIDNLHTQPIIASVDGELFEVWTEHQSGIAQIKTVEADHLGEPPSTVTERSKTGSNGSIGDNKAVRAPIPGTIISVAVREGNDVTIGQELCVLEAMKMKNAIRSPRKGVIASVQVSPGQTVQHRDVLVKFVD